MTDQPTAPGTTPGNGFRVLIAGGGVAAVEALLALRALAGNRASPRLLAPGPEFKYRPLSVTEPFGLAAPRRLDLLEIALEHGATFSRDSLASVDTEHRQATTANGRILDYDALLIGIGARGVDAIPGAITFRDSADGGSFAEVLAELERGTVKRLTFAVPGGTSWPLGLYELALLTSAHLRRRGRAGAKLRLVTPEARPMEVFGRRASAAVGELLERAGVELITGHRPIRFAGGRLTARPGLELACDRVVALPGLRVNRIEGIPQGHGGFIAIDRYGGVLGTERVYAAGDATWFPVKQGGLAGQLADCAASSIASLAGAPVDPQPFRPVLRGALLTEWGPRFMREDLDRPGSGAVARSTLWWPPAKIAGRHLAPYLAAKAGYPQQRPRGQLADLEAPLGDDAADVSAGHEDVLAVALRSADAHARSRDFPGALRWLEVAEDLELYLPGDYERKRAQWQSLAPSGGAA